MPDVMSCYFNFSEERNKVQRHFIDLVTLVLLEKKDEPERQSICLIVVLAN